MNLLKEPEICEECLEYICVHNYPILDINGDCPICYECFNESETIVLNVCKHKFCHSCILCVKKEENGDIMCPYCRRINRGLIEYLDYKVMVCNSLIPAPGSVPFETYLRLFNKFKHCILPTEQMLRFVEEGQELYKEVLFNDMSHQEKKTMLFNYRNYR